MKKLLVAAAVVVVVMALLAWVASWFRAPAAVATAASQPWPGGMGPLEAVAARFPPRQANDAARRLAALAKALPRSDAVDGFVGREIGRGELTIGGAPAIADVSAIRELLLRETLVWERIEGVGGDDNTSAMRGALMTMARTLVASALTKARANDPAAWEDLRALWTLARSLDGQPQMMTRTAALSMMRMVNAVSWKMPLPAPAWLGELQQRDEVRPLLEGFQYSAASYWKDGSRIFPTKMLADSVEKDRKIAGVLIDETKCDVKTEMNDLGPDFSAVWRRAFRYRAEREAAANALRIREGKPVETASRCSDGAWSLDGTTLRFSREIATAPPDRPMPLTLRVAP